MADTLRTLAELQTLLADNNSANISPQDVRDFLISTHLKQSTITAANYSCTSNDKMIFLDASTGAISCALPPATTTNQGQIMFFKAVNAATNKPYITTNIDGAAYTFTSDNDSLITGCDGSAWKKICQDRRQNTHVAVSTISATGITNLTGTTITIINLNLALERTATVMLTGQGYALLETIGTGVEVGVMMDASCLAFSYHSPMTTTAHVRLGINIYGIATNVAPGTISVGCYARLFTTGTNRTFNNVRLSALAIYNQV